MCMALLSNVPSWSTCSECARATVAFLLGFDIYGRGQDLVKAQRHELRPPMQHLRGAAKCWTLLLFPSTELEESKRGGQDETAAIGASHPSRRWLVK